MIMIREDTCPLTLVSLRMALRLMGIEMLSSQLSAGPLSEDSLQSVESHLRDQLENVGSYRIGTDITKWMVDGRESDTVMSLDEAAGAPNGSSPRADLALLLHMVREGDL